MYSHIFGYEKNMASFFDEVPPVKFDENVFFACNCMYVHFVITSNLGI